jgi:hypothetical protein
MTMNTRLHIAEPVNPERLFLHLLDVLSRKPGWRPSWETVPEGEPWRSSPGPLVNEHGATYEHRAKGEQVYQKRTGKPLWKQDEGEYASTLGQGLPAILTVNYATDGPLVWPPMEYREPEDDDLGPMPQHAVSVDFDTAYGYKDAVGGGCADLHAFLLAEVGRYLDDLAKPPRWVWHHEERGTWHEPHESWARGDASRCELSRNGGSVS